MTVKQLSVFIQNEPGKIAKITRALSDGGVDLRAISIADTADFGILRLLVSDIRKATTCLDGQHCMVDITDVIVVAVPDIPGGLSSILDVMTENNIDIEYMYSLIDKGTTDAYMVFRASDTEALLELFEKEGIKTVSGESIGLH